MVAFPHWKWRMHKTNVYSILTALWCRYKTSYKQVRYQINIFRSSGKIANTSHNSLHINTNTAIDWFSNILMAKETLQSNIAMYCVSLTNRSCTSVSWSESWVQPQSPFILSILLTRGEFNNASARRALVDWYLSLIIMCKAWHQYNERPR